MADVIPFPRSRAPRDPLVAHMVRLGIPVNRENYVDLAYPGDDMPTEEEWTAEHEAMLPDELQDWDTFYKRLEETTDYQHHTLSESVSPD
jgi:hypothetical protein